MRYRSILPAAIMIAFCAAYSGGHPALGGHGWREEHDEDQARAAFERGEILPLEQVLSGLKASVAGEISGIELEKAAGIWVYEFKIISPGGRMIEVYVDAKTGKIIRQKGD